MSGSLSSPQGRPLWQGRALALIGIVLVAFSLRSAVASLSPVLDHVAEDFPVAPVIVGLIGAAPPVCFALFGLLTPLFERRFGLERMAVVAIVLMAAGMLLRGLAPDSWSLLAATAVVFAGVGSGNVLLPPLVKKYFADRLGVMMTAYSTTLAVSTFLPPLVAVPVADSLGWRISLGMWGVVAALALVPWVTLLVRSRGDDRAVPTELLVPDPTDGVDDVRDAVAASTGPITTQSASPRVFGRLWRLPLAWALALVFGTSSTMAYVAFAWLPTILVDLGGVTPATAGFLLSLFALVGLPCSMLVPVLVVRFQATRPLFFVAVVAGLVGLAGLLLFPTVALPLWVAIFGLTAIMFPLSLVLLSIRARTPESAVALSGFVQSIGYAIAAVFPLLVGLLHDTSGGWQVPLLVVAGVLVVSVPAGIIAGRRRTIEDEWERRHGRW
ncbi:MULTISPECIES: CynX/NimT family MFS transporter [Microbacterium]|jgi:MFS transporter, CP family, cyanate transporter|uniref:MFS transporter n=1 Tax=Microbacterium paraoxydans TaxID=199592 RepID=A0ABZ2HQD9_9MICO|nr:MULTISPECIES: MFS transporter [Microbacterium]AMG83453.1 ABC transporter permease [Microbacterium sp. PAMC 28756]MPT14846.1 MFS transporter [Microbacterium sp.]QXE30319.1 MFS transporter [Microbacterium paraoxydans]